MTAGMEVTLGGVGRPAPPMLRARELLRRRSIFIPALALIALVAALHFTSTLPVRILGHLLPTLDRLSASQPRVGHNTLRAEATGDLRSPLGHD